MTRLLRCWLNSLRTLCEEAESRRNQEDDGEKERSSRSVPARSCSSVFTSYGRRSFVGPGRRSRDFTADRRSRAQRLSGSARRLATIALRERFEQPRKRRSSDAGFIKDADETEQGMPDEERRQIAGHLEDFEWSNVVLRRTCFVSVVFAQTSVQASRMNLNRLKENRSEGLEIASQSKHG